MKRIFAFVTIVQGLWAISFKEEAHQWVQEFCKQATHEELQRAANLFYFSYQRSCQTLQTQKVLLAFMQETGKLYRAFIATRRDPLHNYEQSNKEELNALYDKAQQAYAAHQALGMTYDAVVKHTVNESTFSPHSYILITQARQNARQAVMHACMQQAGEQIQRLFESQKILQKATEFYQKQQFFVNKRSIMSMLASYLPPLALNAFISFDKNMLTAQKRVLEAWYEMQYFDHAFWELIETTRKQFYSDYYNALIQAMYIKNIPKEFCTILFNEKGSLLSIKQPITLPANL